MLNMVFMFLALLSFFLAAFGIPLGKINLTALGLFFVSLSFLLYWHYN